MIPDLAGRLGLVAVASGAHAGALMLAVGLGVATREVGEPTRQRLLDACTHAAHPGANWGCVVRLAAEALIVALEVIGGDDGP